MLSIEDKELIQKIKQGHLEYFSTIVHTYTKPIYAYIARRISEKDDVEDIVQTTFLDFYAHIDYFDEALPILPYLYGIAKNQVKMYFRAEKQTVSLDERIAATTEDVGDFTDESMQDMLRDLPSEQKNILELLYEGYTYEEIAEKTDKPLNTIRTIIRRTRLKLKKLYEKS